jgi:hypothetical protein
LVKALIASLIVAIAANESRAATASISYSSAPAVNLPGYTTYVFTAYSDELILGFDFYGDGSTDPATSLGFFSPMNQLNPFGQSTVFPDNNVIFPFAGLDPRQDSQFVARACGDCVDLSRGTEGPDFLKGSRYFFPRNEVEFARLVVPDSSRAPIRYRGKIIIREFPNVEVEIPVSGTIPPIPEPASVVLAGFMAMSWLLVRCERFRFQ